MFSMNMREMLFYIRLMIMSLRTAFKTVQEFEPKATKGKPNEP